MHRSYCKLSLCTSVQWYPCAYSFWLPISKTDCVFEGNHIIVCSQTPPDPCDPFVTYLKSHNTLFPHRAELWLHENGSVPTCAWFLTRLQSYFPNDIAGHSIRAGGATNPASHGFPPDLIMQIGRWLSNDWRKYVRCHPALMHALYFSKFHV